MRHCLKCGIDDIKGVIHEHHKNGNHDDNSPDNKMDLCANCHMTLHWKRWKLSDIGLEDVEIIRRKGNDVYEFHSVLNDEITQKIVFKLIFGLLYFHGVCKFERRKYAYVTNEIVNKIILDGSYPYEIQSKCIDFIKSAESYDMEQQQQLNLQYLEFTRDLNIPDEMKLAMGILY